MLRVSKRRHYARAVARVGRMSDARLIVTFLALVAFAGQTYFTQTHVHLGLAAANVQLAGEDSGKSSNHQHGFPFKQYPANCPTCQQLAHVGPALVPAAATVVSPALPIFGRIGFVETTQHFHAPSHIWQGRAPPRI